VKHLQIPQFRPLGSSRQTLLAAHSYMVLGLLF
jgi:hypothetical protein